MLRRLLHSYILLVMVAAAALSGSVEVGAQASPKLSAAASTQPDTYIITGAGFQPGAQLWVNEIPCGELPCAAGSQPGAQLVTVGSDGTFRVEMALTGLNVGRGYRLIAAYGEDWTQDQINSAPTVRVPEYSPGSSAPAAPSVGTGREVKEGSASALPLAAALLFASGVAFAMTRPQRSSGC